MMERRKKREKRLRKQRKGKDARARFFVACGETTGPFGSTFASGYHSYFYRPVLATIPPPLPPVQSNHHLPQHDEAAPIRREDQMSNRGLCSGAPPASVA
jgi:hypothetical protein